MRPQITAFANSPDEGQGHARDFRVRWALEEVGIPYSVRLLTFAELKESEHLRRNPFGSIPTYEEGEITLFESGAIVFHIAQQNEGLLPTDLADRARSIMWMVAALNTVEPPIIEREAFMLQEREKTWFEDRLSLLDANVRKRLGELATGLGDEEWLNGTFSAADLLMVTVLRRLEASNIPERAGLLDEFANLSAYVSRAKARVAYRRAFEAQAEVYEHRAPSR